MKTCLRLRLLESAKNRIISKRASHNLTQRRHSVESDDCVSYDDNNFRNDNNGRSRKQDGGHRMNRQELPRFRHIYRSRSHPPSRNDLNRNEVYNLPLKRCLEFDYQHHRPKEISISNNIIPPNCQVPPRSDAWLALSLSSVITLSSIATSSTSTSRTMSEESALVLSSIIFSISVSVTIGLCYAPLRESLTEHSGIKVFCVRCSKEAMISVLCLLIHVANTSIVMNHSASIAISRNEVWNSNIFYSCWLGLYTCFYLVGDLLNSHNPNGLICSTSHSQRALYLFDFITKLWYMELGSTIALLGVLMDFSVLNCASRQESLAVCNRSFVAGLLSFLSLILVLASLAAHRMAVLGRTNLSLFRHLNDKERSNRLSRRAGTSISILVFVLSSLIAGIVSSPYGPGHKGGSIFLTTWMTFGLSLTIVKNYLECFFISQSEIELPNTPNPLFDLSSRSAGSHVTDGLDDSYKVTDDELLDEIESSRQKHQRKSSQSSSKLVEQLPPKNSPCQVVKIEGTLHADPAIVTNGFNSRATRSRQAQEPAVIEESASIMSNSAPMVFTRKQSYISALEVGSILTHDPIGLNSGNSFYNGEEPDGSKKTSVSLEEQDQSTSLRHSSLQYLPNSCTVPEKSLHSNRSGPPLARKSSYSSMPSLPTLQEGSQEGSKDSSSANNRDKIAMKSFKSTKVFKASSTTKVEHHLKQKSSDNSLSSDPKTIDGKESLRKSTFFDGSSTSLLSSDFNITCDSSSIITDITTEKFEENNDVNPAKYGQTTRKHQHRSPYHDGSVRSAVSGDVTPSLNSNDADLVSHALQYARGIRSLYAISPGGTSGKLKKSSQRKSSRKVNGTLQQDDMRRRDINTFSASEERSCSGSVESLHEASDYSEDELGLDYTC